QPQLAGQLGERKAGRFEALGVGVVAAGNIGCLVQMAAHVDGPVAHTVELLDWASGGPLPPGLKPGVS
ncbi:MAG: glycolate oxidase iron-sulfur subunit, partial [Rhodospirillaceae bacterium]|nr:glycolate oxidase iron-sulfur subunit [Rhodospirillaceae bacterium]